MPESFLDGEKRIELVITKTAVIIVLAIFISAYIPNFFMDVNMQSSFFLFMPTEQMALYYKKPEIMLKEFWVYLQKLAGAKTNKNPSLIQCNKNGDINFVGIF